MDIREHMNYAYVIGTTRGVRVRRLMPDDSVAEGEARRVCRENGLAAGNADVTELCLEVNVGLLGGYVYWPLSELAAQHAKGEFFEATL